MGYGGASSSSEEVSLSNRFGAYTTTGVTFGLTGSLETIGLAMTVED